MRCAASSARRRAIGLVLVSLVLAAAIGPLAAPYSPEQFHITASSRTRRDFWLGTDQFGRDLLSRILLGARPTLLLAVLATALGTGIGAVIGTLGVPRRTGGRGHHAHRRRHHGDPRPPIRAPHRDRLGANAVNALIAIGIAFAPGMARITRSVALTVRKQDYVNAAVARGESSRFIVLSEMLPNVIALIVVETTIRVAFAVMTLATLSFLGLGAQPRPRSGASWSRGPLLSLPQSLDDGLARPGHRLVAIGFNLLGDGLRDALNSRAH